VSLVYRNDDGVNARTLSPVRRTNQRKRGHDFCPRFCGISQETEAGIRSQVSGIAGRLGLGRYSEVGRFRVAPGTRAAQRQVR
jgi:hypothetical protein